MKRCLHFTSYSVPSCPSEAEEVKWIHRQGIWEPMRNVRAECLLFEGKHKIWAWNQWVTLSKWKKKTTCLNKVRKKNPSMSFIITWVNTNVCDSSVVSPTVCEKTSQLTVIITPDHELIRRGHERKRPWAGKPTLNFRVCSTTSQDAAAKKLCTSNLSDCRLWQRDKKKCPAGCDLRVFVFERPPWIFALVHHDGRNSIVWRHLTAIELWSTNRRINIHVDDKK